jgi:acetyl esterase/lipase
MTKEYWYFLCGMLMILLPLAFVVTVKKLHLLEVRPDQTIVYKVAGEKDLTLHAFTANGDLNASPAPALLLFHGGSWLYGGPEAFYPQCQYFAALGFNCYSAQYRLGVNNRVDVRNAVQDAEDALQYLIDNAEDLHIDPENIVAGGGSSGGHLAAMLGVSPTGKRPAALILYNPMLDLSPGTPDHHLVKDYWEVVSPLHHIDAAIPPSLILVGSEDPEVPVTTVQAFCQLVLSLGGRCELAIYEGQSHGFFNGKQYREKTNLKVLKFLSELRG